MYIAYIQNHPGNKNNFKLSNLCNIIDKIIETISKILANCNLVNLSLQLTFLVQLL